MPWAGSNGKCYIDIHILISCIYSFVANDFKVFNDCFIFLYIQYLHEVATNIPRLPPTISTSADPIAVDVWNVATSTPRLPASISPGVDPMTVRIQNVAPCTGTGAMTEHMGAATSQKNPESAPHQSKRP